MVLESLPSHGLIRLLNLPEKINTKKYIRGIFRFNIYHGSWNITYYTCESRKTQGEERTQILPLKGKTTIGWSSHQ